MNHQWKQFSCKITELKLDITLLGGQCFRWKEVNTGMFRGVVHNAILTLKQDQENVYYINHTTLANDRSSEGRHKAEYDVDEDNPPKQKRGRKRQIDNISTTASSDATMPLLHEYFNLSHNLCSMYKRWSEADDNFATLSVKFPGVRILCQDPVENLISFICSSNNNISRISHMVEKLCVRYGERLGDVDGVTYHKFPALDRLAEESIEGELRAAGFGYRAKYIQQAARGILKKSSVEGVSGREWLLSLRQRPYREVHAELVSLSGIGAKVADCICLMSMNKLQAIPVDTHVWQITVRDYLPHLAKCKSMTDRVYRQIGDFYRERFGEHAGWANSVLFSADLKKFKESQKK